MKNGDWRINRSPSMTPEGKKEKYYTLKNEVFDLLGNECKGCGFTDRRALQIDHIFGGGSKEHKSKSGASFLYHVLLHIENYQILCANCNWIKRARNHEQPIGLKI